eukprot:scaffold488_cov109-Skeletonema_dohrnii-CCMP3373.AAC.17
MADTHTKSLRYAVNGSLEAADCDIHGARYYMVTYDVAAWPISRQRACAAVYILLYYRTKHDVIGSLEAVDCDIHARE